MNPSVLERQLIHMDLRKGMNERTRPECGDPSSLLTLVQNLQQEQDGAWVKRPGLTAIGDTLASVRRLIRLRGGGLGAIAGAGTFHVLAENANDWVETFDVSGTNGAMPHFVTTIDQVASSEDRPTSNMVASATNAKYHYVAYSAGTLYRVSVFDRATGSQIHTYQVPSSQMNTAPKMTFANERYLFVFWGHTSGGGNTLHCSVVDTNTTWEINFGTSAIATPASGNVTVLDVAYHTDRAFALTQDAVYAANTSGALIGSPVVASAGSSIAASADKLWVHDATNLIAYDVTDLSTILVASAAHGAVAGAIDVTDANRVYMVGSDNVYITTADNGTTYGSPMFLGEWNAIRPPVYVSASTSVYLPVRKDEPGSLNSIQALINITSGAVGDTLGLTGAGKYSWMFRCETILEPFNAVTAYQGRCSVTGSEVATAVAVRTVARGLSYSVCVSTLHRYRSCGTACFGEQVLVAGGTPSVVGSTPREVGFVDMPTITAADSGNAGNPNGAYRYVAVYRHVDETGTVAWSRVSVSDDATVVTNTVNVTVTPPTVGLRGITDTGSWNGAATIVTEVYRTLTGGTVFYLCASSANGTDVQQLVTDANGFWTVEDNYSDATLASQAILFRQPGTPNSPLDRYPCPPCAVIISHKDRVYCSFGGKVYYSSFFVDGETPWFHPQFNMFVHGGSGPITGLASLDGRLVVFKRDAVFVIDGDGPGEAGPSGNEFGTPNRIATEYGCIDHRSIQVFAGGILYRSVRGVELLTRGFELKFIGDRVQNTVANYPYVVGSIIDHDSRYRLLLAETEGSASWAGINGVEVVYDTQSDCWSKNVYNDGTVPQDVATMNLSGVDTSVYANSTTGVFKADIASGKDSSTFVPWRITTGWIRTGQQARQFIDQIQLLAKKLTNHKVTISAAYDYVDDFTTDTQTFEPDVINAQPIEQIQKNTARKQVLAARFDIQEGSPTDTTSYPVTTGRGCDILGLTVQVAVKAGAPQLHPDNKG